MKFAGDMINLEATIAKEYSTDEILDGECYSTAECFVENFDEYGFMDFKEYFQVLSENSKYINDYFADSNRSVLARKDVLQKLNRDFYSKFQPRIIINYFFYRLIMSRRNYLTLLKKPCLKAKKQERKNSSLNISFTGKQRSQETILLNTKWKCFQRTKINIQEVADRLDLVTIDEEDKLYLDEFVFLILWKHFYVGSAKLTKLLSYRMKCLKFKLINVTNFSLAYQVNKITNCPA